MSEADIDEIAARMELYVRQGWPREPLAYAIRERMRLRRAIAEAAAAKAEEGVPA